MKNNKNHAQAAKTRALAKPVSRRAFFGLTAATGTLSVLGTSRLGNSFVTAYADEANNEFFQIVEVGRKQMPVIFVDPIKRTQVYDKGIKVNLKTYDYPGRPSVNVTSDEGLSYALADMTDMIDEYQRTQVQDCYSGSVEVTATGEGYQDYEDLHHTFITGVPKVDEATGMYVEIPVQKKISSPYASCLCLRGADIMCFEQEVGVQEENTATYDIFIRVKNLPKDKKEIRLQFLADRKPIPIRPHDNAKSSEEWKIDDTTIGAYSTTEGICEFYFVGEWFSGKGSLPQPGAKLSIKVVEQSTKKQIIVHPRLTLIDPKCPSGHNESDRFTFRFGKEGGVDSVDNDANNTVTEKKSALSKDFLSKFDINIPWAPVKIKFKSSGEVTISINFYKDPRKKSEWKGLEHQPMQPDDLITKHFSDQCSSIEEGTNKFFTKGFKGFDKDQKEGMFSRRPVTTKFDVTVKGDAEFTGKDGYDTAKKRGTFNVSGKATVSVCAKLEVSEVWFVGPVPINLTFDASLTLGASVQLGICIYQITPHNAALPAGQQNSVIPKFEYAKSIYWPTASFVVTVPLNLEFGLALGVGVRGFLGAFVRGYIKIDITNSVSIDPKTIESLKFGYTQGKCTMGVEVKFEIFLFTITFFARDLYGPKVWWEKPSTNSNKQVNEPNYDTDLFGDPYTPGNGDPANAQPVIITDKVFKNVVEATGNLATNGAITYSANRVANVKIPNPTIIQPCSSNSTTMLYNPVKGVMFETTKVREGVFFSGHIKTFKYEDSIYLLRISAVDIEVPAGFGTYTVGDCTMLIPGDGVKLPKPKRNADGTVVFDSNDNIVYDTAGLADNEFAKISEGAFGCLGTSNSTRKDAINAYYAELDKEIAKSKLVYAGKANFSNSTINVTRTRLTCIKYDKSSNTWGETNVIDFPNEQTEAEYLRYNCFDSDLDAIVDEERDGYVKVVLNSASRMVDGHLPTFDQTKAHMHSYRLNLNLKTMQAEDARIAGKDSSYTAPRLAENNSYTFLRTQGAREVDPNQLGINFVIEKPGTTEEKERINLSNGLGVTDERFTKRIDKGVNESYYISSTDKSNQRIFSAWVTQEENTPQGGGMAVFWTTYKDSNGNIMHDFVKTVDGVENILYLGTATVNDITYNKLLRYVIVNKADSDGIRRYSYATFYYSDYNGAFNPEVSIVRDKKGSSNVANIYRGEDANHMYASRTFDAPQVTNTGRFNLDEGEELVGHQYGPFVSDQVELYDEGQKASLYQILELRWNDVTQTFFEPFALCQLEFSPDSVALIGEHEGVKDFLVTHITEAAQVKGDIVMVSCGLNASVSLADSPVMRTTEIRQNEENKVTVRVTNNGNVPINAFKVELFDVTDDTKKLIKTFNLTQEDLKNKLDREEPLNYKADLDASGKPTGTYTLMLDENDDNGILWPGATRSYILDYTLNYETPTNFKLGAVVSVPGVASDYLFDNEKNATIMCCNNTTMRTATPDMFDPNSNDYQSISGDLGSDIKACAPVYEYLDEDGNSIAQTDANAVNTDFSVLQNPDAKPAENAVGAFGSSSTGDNNLTVGLGAAALGAVAAGVAAYEKRRHDNECGDGDAE